MKTTCTFCNKKAVLNLKSVDGHPTLKGPQLTLGAEELYLPVCAEHYSAKLGLDPSGLELNAALARLDAERASVLLSAQEVAVAETKAK